MTRVLDKKATKAAQQKQRDGIAALNEVFGLPAGYGRPVGRARRQTPLYKRGARFPTLDKDGGRIVNKRGFRIRGGEGEESFWTLRRSGRH